MSSIVLEPGVKDMILNDCKDFLCSEEWYAERGKRLCRSLTWRALNFPQVFHSDAVISYMVFPEGMYLSFWVSRAQS